MKKSYLDSLKEHQRTVSIEEKSCITEDERQQKLNRSLSKVTQDKIVLRRQNQVIEMRRNLFLESMRRNNSADGGNTNSIVIEKGHGSLVEGSNNFTDSQFFYSSQASLPLENIMEIRKPGVSTSVKR